MGLLIRFPAENAGHPVLLVSGCFRCEGVSVAERFFFCRFFRPLPAGCFDPADGDAENDLLDDAEYCFIFTSLFGAKRPEKRSGIYRRIAPDSRIDR